MADQHPLTMKDIARELGVSVATVSRALHDSPRISQPQRERIQAYARQLNFSPNPAGGVLRHARQMRSSLIGVIVPDLAHYFFSTVLSGIVEEARARDYYVMVAESHERYEQEVEACATFAKAHCCGVIVSQAKDTTKHTHFEQLMHAGIPLVFYDRICTGVDCSRVVVDDYMGAYTAVNHLIDTGCRRIAYYGTSMRMEIGKNRFNGYKDALARHKLPVDENLVRLCDNRSAAENITPDLLDMDNPPDAFFAINDDTAIGIMYSAKRMGLRVPEDISVCGFTNGQRALACDPPLTTVEQRGRQVGEEACNILISHVEGTLPPDKVERRVVRTRLVVRGSTR